MKISRILILFLILTCIFTYPLTLKINSSIPGFYSTDESYAALWYFWWVKYTHENHLNPANFNMLAVPFGSTLKLGNIYWHLLNKGMALITNPILTYNIQILFSFIIAGLITYFLVFYFLNNSLAALFSAIIFTFCPYHAVRSWQHLGLVHIQWMPLYILSLLVLRNKKTLRNAVLVALSFSLVMTFDLYYAYFMFIVTILLVIYDLSYRKDMKQTLNFIKSLSISLLFILIIESFDLYSALKIIFSFNKIGKAEGVYGYIRPFEDLFSQSARPLSYILPATAHPIFGKFTESFIGGSWYGQSFTEHSLYLGWVPLILAFMAFRRWRKSRKIQGQSPKSGDSPYYKEDFYIGFFILLAIAAWLFSQPPWWNILGFKLYMPAFFLYKIAPMFRAYCRFGIVVMLAVAVLAGFGLKFILERFKSRNVKIAIACLFSGLVLFEFWNWPPFKVIDVSGVPAVYYWLKDQPGGLVIAEYPLDINGANELYRFYQTAHEKKIINVTTPGTYANKVANTITKLSQPYTAGVLKWMGVKYVLVHKEDYLNTELTEEKEEIEGIPQNTGLKFIKSFPPQECPREDIMCVQKTGPIDVYEVVAQPIEPIIAKEK